MNDSGGGINKKNVLQLFPGNDTVFIARKANRSNRTRPALPKLQSHLIN